MIRKRILALLLAFVLISGTAAVWAAGGDSGDPLVSLSYLTETYIPSLLQKADSAVNSALAPVRAGLSGNSAGSFDAGSSFDVWLVSAGGGVSMQTGCSVMLLSGSASLEVSSGAVVDVTNGVTASSGALARNVRLLGAENCRAYVSAGTGAVLAVSGGSVSGGEALKHSFTDIQYSNWFFVDVSAAHARGLIDGMSASSYAPDGQLTTAQAVKLAACLHQRYYKGSVTLSNSSSGRWYQSYIDYAIANDILDEAPSETVCNAPISRSDFVRIFYRALPRSNYAAINSIADNAIPDVSLNEANASEIYTFYRAGILTGSDDAGSFLSSSSIRRSEVAAILTRMYEPGARKNVTLS